MYDMMYWTLMKKEENKEKNDRGDMFPIGAMDSRFKDCYQNTSKRVSLCKMVFFNQNSTSIQFEKGTKRNAVLLT
jgi:hypothetical protein